MELKDFDFNLPKELIAQFPCSIRDESRLITTKGGKFLIDNFYNLDNYLQEGDLLIFNDSRVINAKIELIKNSSAININLNRPIGDNSWLGFAKPAKKLNEGDIFEFGNNKILINEKLDNGEIKLKFILDKLSIFEFLELYGNIPLPQYIKRDKNIVSDNERYQNIYSKIKGSVAAPTAGLHFSENIFKKLDAKNINHDFVTLHVGAGTFLPVKTENINDHKMHLEWCEISARVADKINKAKENNQRIIMVGTTALRTIESCAVNNKVIAQTKETDIFIRPGYDFQIADGLITNFHLPKSTLFMLVCAFAGMDKMKKLYNYAIENKMRFFSYGDSMFLTRNK